MSYLFVILNIVKTLFSFCLTRFSAMLRVTSCFLGCSLLLSSCSELLYLNIEQMLPPEIAPQHTARSIGVVSNFSEHNVMVVNEDVIILPCDADTVKKHVAQTFANSGIMDRVVVLDSLLYHPDSTSSHTLAQDEVNALCELLDVKMIYSIDYACLIYNPASSFISRPLNAYLCSRIYAPTRDSIQSFSVMDKETLDYWVNDTGDIGPLFLKIPALLAQNAISPYLPSWEERERVYYHDRLCYPLREAKVYVYEGNWEAAAQQWQTLTGSKVRAYRYMAYYNLALYHEMTDDIDAALSSLDLAKEQATRKNKRGEEKGVVPELLEQYREVLQTRKSEVEKLEQYF